MKLLESELREQMTQLTEQNIELRRTCERQGDEPSSQPDQPSFTSTPAYKSLMATLGLGANSCQVRSPAPAQFTSSNHSIAGKKPRFKKKRNFKGFGVFKGF